MLETMWPAVTSHLDSGSVHGSEISCNSAVSISRWHQIDLKTQGGSVNWTECGEKIHHDKDIHTLRVCVGVCDCGGWGSLTWTGGGKWHLGQCCALSCVCVFREVIELHTAGLALWLKPGSVPGLSHVWIQKENLIPPHTHTHPNVYHLPPLALLDSHS